MNKYKISKQNEYLVPPKALNRGEISTIDILKKSNSEAECKGLINKWARGTYDLWSNSHNVVEEIAKGFLRS